MRLILLCFLALALASCAPQTDPLAYQQEAAEVLLHGAVDATEFSATLTLAALGEGETPDGRAFTLTYTAPTSLAGLCVTRADGTTTLTRGALSLPLVEPLGDLALPASLFCIDPPLETAAVVEQNGTTLNRITASDDEGDYAIWLGEDGYPRRIEARVGGRSVAVDLLAPIE